MIRIPRILAAVLLVSALATAGDVKVKMEHRTTTGPSVSITTIAGTDWTDEPQEKILKAPKFRATPKWGAIPLGAGTDKLITVALDDAGPGEALFYCDANNNEDLTDDGDPAKEYSKESKTLGKFWKLQVEYGKAKSEYQMYVYWFRDNKKSFSAYRNNEWWEGSATLGSETLRFGIVDQNSDALYDDLENLAIVFDYNQDGTFDGAQDSNERYTANEPIPAGGKGWTVKSVSQMGDEIVFTERDEPVAVKIPLGSGATAPDFTGQDAEGNDVSLSSFMGKVVLLWFWSYQSGDASLALEEHRKIWKEYRNRGYAILGVNIDTDKDKAQEFAKSHEMEWANVYDGGMMGGEIAKTYRLWTYPRLYLIDADGVIRNNSVYVATLAKAVEEMLSDADAEPLTVAKPEEVKGFVPKVEKGDWWVVFHQRHGEYDTGDFLLFMVMEANEQRLGIVCTSTMGWSYALHVDRATWNVTRIVPTYTDWDQEKERINIAPEKDRAVDVEGAPSLAMLRQYPLVDVLFHVFPHPGQGKLTAITEQVAAPTQTEAGTLDCETFLDVNGRLIGKFKGKLGNRVVRIKQTWDKDLPFPRRVTYSNSITNTRGSLVLCRSGKKVGLAFPAAAFKYRLLGMDSQIADVPVSRCPQRDLIGEDAVAAACAKLAPGKATQPLDVRGTAWFHRGDTIKVYWQIRAIPKAISGPKPTQQERTVEIPVSGTFVIECADIRRVGEEDLVFLLAFGDDTRALSYDPMTGGSQGQQAKTIAEIMTGSGPAMFSNPDYWTDPDPKKAKWDRVSALRARRYGGYSFNSTGSGRIATTWVLVLRREDLSLRAAYGFHLDANLRPGTFGVVVDSLQQGPAFVRQSLQLVRPQDWMLIQAFAGLKIGQTKGNVLNLSPKDEGFFRYELLKDEEAVTQLVKNDKFFTAFAELLAKRQPPPEDRKGKKVRQAKVALTEQDVARLESGFANGDYSGIIRRLEDGVVKRDANVFRTTNGPGLWVYHGFDGTYTWWKESLVLNWKEGYLARLRLYVPTPPKPGS